MLGRRDRRGRPPLISPSRETPARAATSGPRSPRSLRHRFDRHRVGPRHACDGVGSVVLLRAGPGARRGALRDRLLQVAGQGRGLGRRPLLLGQGARAGRADRCRHTSPWTRSTPSRRRGRRPTTLTRPPTTTGTPMRRRKYFGFSVDRARAGPEGGGSGDADRLGPDPVRGGAPGDRPAPVGPLGGGAGRAGLRHRRRGDPGAGDDRDDLRRRVLLPRRLGGARLRGVRAADARARGAASGSGWWRSPGCSRASRSASSTRWRCSRRFSSATPLARAASLRRAVAFGAAAALGAAPALLYNLWSLGSPLRFAYSHAVSVPGRSGHAELGLNSSGFFGITAPRPGAAIDLLLSGRGILTLTPVLVMGVGGRRADGQAWTSRGGERDRRGGGPLLPLQRRLLAAARRRHARAPLPDPGAALPGDRARPRLPQASRR